MTKSKTINVPTFQALPMWLCLCPIPALPPTGDRGLVSGRTCHFPELGWAPVPVAYNDLILHLYQTPHIWECS